MAVSYLTYGSKVLCRSRPRNANSGGPGLPALLGTSYLQLERLAVCNEVLTGLL